MKVWTLIFVLFAGWNVWAQEYAPNYAAIYPQETKVLQDANWSQVQKACEVWLSYPGGNSQFKMNPHPFNMECTLTDDRDEVTGYITRQIELENNRSQVSKSRNSKGDQASESEQKRTGTTIVEVQCPVVQRKTKVYRFESQITCQDIVATKEWTTKDAYCDAMWSGMGETIPEKYMISEENVGKKRTICTTK